MSFVKIVLALSLSLLMVTTSGSYLRIEKTSGVLEYLLKLMEGKEILKSDSELTKKFFEFVAKHYPEYLVDFHSIKDIDPDTFRTPFEMVINQGYSMEIHKILTDDNYILTAWRVYKTITQKNPILLQHGLLDSSFTFILNTGQESLAYTLADQGYDVWLTNNRGNRYSNEHLYWTPNKNYDQYWAFSWDEMGKYDVPANIQYILDQTGASKVHFLGHSEGTTQMFAAIALNPDIQNSLQSFVGLGPVAFLGNEMKIIPFLIKVGFAGLLVDGLNDLNDEALIVPKGMYSPGLGYICDALAATCVDIVEAITGFTKPIHLNYSRMSVMGSHEPGGTSLQNLAHWMQAATNSSFQMYNYGSAAKNFLAYGTDSPPFYNISNWGLFNTPTYFIQGTRDTLSDYTDLQHALTYFPDTVKVDIVQDYNHLDYVWGTTAYIDIYPNILSFLQSAQAEIQ